MSGLDPSAYIQYFDRIPQRERFGNHLGGLGVIVYAVVWLLLLPTTGIAAFFFPDPLARAGLYLFWVL